MKIYNIINMLLTAGYITCSFGFTVTNNSIYEVQAFVQFAPATPTNGLPDTIGQNGSKAEINPMLQLVITPTVNNQQAIVKNINPCASKNYTINQGTGNQYITISQNE